jgi:hypothetical protein
MVHRYDLRPLISEYKYFNAIRMRMKYDMLMRTPMDSAGTTFQREPTLRKISR